eukprot:572538_1
MRCLETFEIDPIVAVYGLLWYLNSIYGIVLMIIESNNVCFFEWCPVCIVNITVPLLWLLIITMVDSCCIKYWSLNKWNRRHYGAAFLYFAIFTNQLLIFGSLCLYGFTVWSRITTATCHASNHLYYGFFTLLSISTALILWIGFYQSYAATKYLCTYHAVLDVKRRQMNTHSKPKNDQEKNGKHPHGRKYSLESNSTNISTMSLTFIGSIFRYGSETEADHDQSISIDIGHDGMHEMEDRMPLTNTSSAVESLPPTLPTITPLPSGRIELQLMDSYEEIEAKELSGDSLVHDPSASESDSPSAFNIEIAGIVIPTKKLTKKGYKKRRRHKSISYKAVDTNTPNTLEVVHLETDEQKEKAKEEENDILDEEHLVSLPLIGKAIVTMSHYFERLKEDPSTADLCIICYDSFRMGDYLARLQCRHVYHKNCIRVWLANSKHCPLCDMNEKNINLKFKI